jgi:hypothetical protein
MSPRVLLLLLVGACAGPTKTSPQTAGSGSGSESGQIVCREVTPTGSLFSHTECLPADQVQAERDDSQRLLRDIDQRSGQATIH